MMSIPKTPCPVKGLVPWARAVYPIVWRGQHPVLGWVYTIHEKTKDRGLQIHWNVSQQDIVRSMEAFAIFKPNQLVQLGPMVRRRIISRKWSFERGSMFYLIEGAQRSERWSIEQNELLERIRMLEEEHA